MGFEDRSYTRESSFDGTYGRSFGARPPMMWVSRIAILNIVIWIIDSAIPSHPISALLALDTDLFRQHFKIYQLVTSGFVHAPLGTPNGLTHVLFNMLFLWMLGREVEMKLGWKEFLRFYLLSIVFSGLTWWATTVLANPSANAALIGASGGVSAVVILFALSYPQRRVMFMMMLEMPAWVFGLIYVGLDIFGSFARPDSGVAFSAHLGGAAFAAGYHFWHLNFGTLFARITPRGGKLRMRRPKLRVHRPEKEPDARLEKDADRVLDKLYKEGENSLSPKERKVLESYSRKMREKRGE